ncbi:MAG: hypothetical protein HOL85_04425 [Rhodospirillaceae bacterium]|nr:hypothetical protein [Rhodospirillaceae bacterium]MBT6139496.1 hypothetical protein [Rhodospirillaceae bacterium]
MQQSQEIIRRRKLPFNLGLEENDVWALHIVYGLFALSSVTAIPALLGLLLVWLKRGELAGTWLEEHATWQIRTFFIMVIATVLSMILAATFVLMPIAWLLAGTTWLWFLYRTIKGWLRLSNQQGFEDAKSIL